jgi:hypothetical protein
MIEVPSKPGAVEWAAREQTGRDEPQRKARPWPGLGSNRRAPRVTVRVTAVPASDSAG